MREIKVDLPTLGYPTSPPSASSFSSNRYVRSSPGPPSPPQGPPRGTYFSRRKATQPFPPPPALTRIFASSMNIVSYQPSALSYQLSVLAALRLNFGLTESR